MSHVTYNRIQQLLLFPAIHKVYMNKRKAIIDKYKGIDLHVIGDGCCDSPGYSVKYRTYTVIMEASSSEIIYFTFLMYDYLGSKINGPFQFVSLDNKINNNR